jgi:hypothetical protein
MSEVSRPLQVVLLLTAAFGGLWFVALRPKSDTGSSPPAATRPAQPAPHKSALPGGLGRAVDKANATKRQGDAQAAATDRAGSAPESGAPAPTASTPAPTPRPAAASRTPGLGGVPVSPSRRAGQVVSSSLIGSQNAAVSSGVAAVGMFATAILGSGKVAAINPTERGIASAGRPHVPSPAHHLSGVTPGMVRHALASGDVVVLLFWGANSSDDRLVRSELSQVDRRGGRVHAWPVAAGGLSRFKNVLHGIDVVQTPTVIVMARGAEPRMFEGYTDHTEIDQATLVALTRT